MEGGSIMSWQKCPICNGSGNDPWIGEIPLSICSYTKHSCPTCKGTRIISQLTGMPPVIEEKHNLFEPLESSTQTTTQDGSNLSSRES